MAEEEEDEKEKIIFRLGFFFTHLIVCAGSLVEEGANGLESLSRKERHVKSWSANGPCQSVEESAARQEPVITAIFSIVEMPLSTT